MIVDQMGSVLRSFQPEDLSGVVDLLNQAEKEVTGQDFTSPENFSADMKSIGFDPQTDTAVILTADGRYAGYAEVFAGKNPAVRLRSYGLVHPAFHGRGYGTRLIQWSEERGRQLVHQAPPGTQVVLHNFVYAAQTDSIELVKQNGYRHIRSNYRMLIDLDDNLQQPKVPDGIILRPIENTEEDLRAALSVDYQAFRDHWGMVDEPYEEYFQRLKQQLMTRPAYDLSACRVAIAGDVPVGMTLCSLWRDEDADKGWVNGLGVLKSWRKRGIGMALLLEAFAEFKKRGKKRAGLYVDAENLSGALKLYLQAGMRVELETQIYEKKLRQGIDLMVRG